LPASGSAAERDVADVDRIQGAVDGDLERLAARRSIRRTLKTEGSGSTSAVVVGRALGACSRNISPARWQPNANASATIRRGDKPLSRI
jgi:hypothetical protein